MFNKITIPVFCLVSLVSFAMAQDQNGEKKAEELLPKGWKLYSSGRPSDSDLAQANKSQEEWRVSLQKGSLRISTDSVEADNRDIKKLPTLILKKLLTLPIAEVGEGAKKPQLILWTKDGWFLGFDFGEWGGSLWWFSPDGKKEKELLGNNIHGLVQTSSGIMVLTGLSHLFIDEGKVILVIPSNQKGEWKTKDLVDLKSCPKTFFRESERSLLVVTNRAIVRVNTSGEVHELFKPGYRGLYPNSVVETESKAIFIGIRQFVVGLIPNGKKFDEFWFIPSNYKKSGSQDDGIRQGTRNSVEF